MAEGSGRSVDYTYDGAGRLIEEDVTDPTLGNMNVTYTYDAAGNRSTRVDSSGSIYVVEIKNWRVQKFAAPR